MTSTPTRGEATNLAPEHPDIVSQLTRQLLTWNKSMPADNGAKPPKERAPRSVKPRSADPSP